MKIQTTTRNIRRNVTLILTSLIFCGLLGAAFISSPCWAGTHKNDFSTGDWVGMRNFGMSNYGRGVYGAENGVLTFEFLQPGGGETRWFFWDNAWPANKKDYTLETRTKLVSDDLDPKGWVAWGLSLRTGTWRGYNFLIDFHDKTTLIQKFSQKSITLSSKPFEAAKDVWYKLKVVAKGTYFQFWIDDKLIDEVEDDTHPQGFPSFVIRNATVHYDWFVLTGPEVPDLDYTTGPLEGYSDLSIDSVPPARITDLEAVELQPIPGTISYSSLTLRWTAPGDDGNLGQAHHYDILSSREPITDINDLTHTQPVSLSQIPKPAKSGEKQKTEIDGLGADTYYFAIVSYDDVFNSSLSNVLKVKLPQNLLSDVTYASEFGNGSMALCLDQDMNGLTDLYLVSDELYLNQGDGKFELKREWDFRGGLAEMAAVADYDKSEGPDILTTRSHKLQLHQHASVFYQDTTEEAGLNQDIEPEWVTFVDINQDNWLDIYMSVNREPSLVYLNNGDATFTENAAAALGLNLEDVETVLFCDLNGDNRVDAYIPDDWVYFQEQDGQFARHQGAGILPDSITDACVGDYDNDGDMDVYVCNDGEANSLYQNNGLGQFEDVTGQTKTGDEGDGITANFVDFNNDGMLDLYVLNRNDPSVLYIQQSDGTFEAHRDPEELDLERPSSAAFGDFDGDGDVDIYVTQSYRDPGRMYRNNNEGNHWLHVKVVGTLSNTDALGAKVYVTTPDGTQMREVRSQTGWCSDSLPVEFGLGTHTKADTVDIRWPSGQWQSLHNVSADQLLTVEEGDMSWATMWGDIRRTALLQNFPNPFNPDTWIPFVLGEDAVVTLNIFDISGGLVRRLDLGVHQAGVYTKRERAIYWDGRNTNGEQVSSGVYFYQLTAGDFNAIRKMVILK